MNTEHLVRILFQVPSLDTIYAGRTIYRGYENAFRDLGHEFRFLTAGDDLQAVLRDYRPDLLFTSLNHYFLKFLDVDAVIQARRAGLRVFVNTPFWCSPLSRLRVNEAASLNEDARLRELIQRGLGDVYYNVCEPGDERMDGFEAATGQRHVTVPLAADRLLQFPEPTEKFRADISFIGTYLPEKRPLFRQWVFPLRKRHDLRLYGQDWTPWDRAAGWAQRACQYFNWPALSRLRRPKLALEDERRIYSSSQICINLHEQYQRQCGGDCNERTFKIPLCGGFEITDDVACIRRYYREDEEIVIAHDTADWFDKIEYYLRYPEKRLPIIEAGRRRTLAEHTYHHRAETFLGLAVSTPGP